MYQFGSGVLFAIPTTGDVTPRKFGVLQDVAVEFSSAQKELYGQNKYPVDVASGKGKISIKAKAANISAGFFNAIFFGADLASGYESLVDGEAGTVPAASAYTITTANAASFKEDRGVIYKIDGKPIKKITSGSPAAGEYKVDAVTGIYTFAATDANAAVKLSYTRAVTGSGQTLHYANPLMGQAVEFMLELTGKYKGKEATLRLYRATSTKLSIDFKNEDHAIPNFEAGAYSNDAGDVFDWFFSE